MCFANAASYFSMLRFGKILNVFLAHAEIKATMVQTREVLLAKYLEPFRQSDRRASKLSNC